MTLARSTIETMKQLLQKGIRIDGRELNEFRRIETTKLGNGQVEIHIGDSKAIGKCIIEPIEIKDEHGGELQIVVNFIPMGNKKHNNVRGSKEQIEVSKIVERGLKSTKAIDVDGLIIVMGKYAWKVTVVINVIDDDGNLVDLVSLCCIGCLLLSKHKEVEIIGSDVVFYQESERKAVSLPIANIPVTVSFGICDGIVIVDPSSKEQEICNSKFTVSINSDGDICGIQQSGTPLSLDVVKKCIHQAKQYAEKFVLLLKQNFEITNS